MKNNKLTDRQKEIFTFIKKYIKKNSYPPSRREIADHFEIQPNAVTDFIKILIKKGKISVAPEVARGIRVL